jgi:hypothetical protein
VACVRPSPHAPSRAGWVHRERRSHSVSDDTSARATSQTRGHAVDLDHSQASLSPPGHPHDCNRHQLWIPIGGALRLASPEGRLMRRLGFPRRTSTPPRATSAPLRADGRMPRLLPPTKQQPSSWQVGCLLRATSIGLGATASPLDSHGVPVVATTSSSTSARSSAPKAHHAHQTPKRYSPPTSGSAAPPVQTARVPSYVRAAADSPCPATPVAGRPSGTPTHAANEPRAGKPLPPADH